MKPKKTKIILKINLARYARFAQNDSIGFDTSEARHNNNCLLKEIGNSKQFAISKPKEIGISKTYCYKRHLSIFSLFTFPRLDVFNFELIWHLNGINRKLETLTSSWSLINNSGLPKILLWFWGSSIYQFFPSISIQLFEDGDHRTGHLNINCIVELWWEK